MKLWMTFAAAAAFGQVPHVGEISLYGLRKVPAEKVRSALGVRKGDPLPPSKSDLEETLEKIPGIVQARIEAVCCEGGDAILFVGVEEKGAPHFAFRSPPAGNGALPEAMVKTHEDFLAAVAEAARRGSTAEDLTKGHSLMADPAARKLQQEFATLAAASLAVLRDVLRTAAEPDQRAIAATLMGYAPDKAAVLDDLQYAMQDPDESVRANAMRSLHAIAVLARLRPDLKIQIAPTWFIEMLNSIVLSDRTRAAEALVALTERDARETLGQIRERALDAVVEMARWPTLRYALPPYILVGRIAGLSERQIHDTWSNGERERVIEGVLKPARVQKKPR